jgi:RNA polymerase sigma-70 factor (ECF subfamily)
MTNAFPLLTAAGNGPADLLLVQAALRGERAAVDALLGRLGCIPRFVRRLDRMLGLGLAADALEDVVQQVYAALWPRLPEFHGRNALETWVYAYCRNCLRGAARAAGRHRPRSSADALASAPDAADDPAGVVERNEVLGALRDALDGLPADEREAVTARHLDGQSFEDLARATGVAVSTIKDRCYRAMQRLADRLGRRLRLP